MHLKKTSLLAASLLLAFATVACGDVKDEPKASASTTPASCDKADLPLISAGKLVMQADLRVVSDEGGNLADVRQYVPSTTTVDTSTGADCFNPAKQSSGQRYTQATATMLGAIWVVRDVVAVDQLPGQGLVAVAAEAHRGIVPEIARLR